MLGGGQGGKFESAYFTVDWFLQHNPQPRVINVDKHAAYPIAMEALKKMGRWLKQLNYGK
jgi:transposase-like protein